MKVYPNTRSNTQPEQKIIDEYSVWIASDIQPVHEAGAADQDGSGFDGYEYTLTQYDKDEYIKMMDDRNAALEADLTDTQLALAELYESMS